MEEKEFAAQLEQKMADLVKRATANLVTKDDLEKEVKEIDELVGQVKELNDGALGYQKQIDDLLVKFAEATATEEEPEAETMGKQLKNLFTKENIEKVKKGEKVSMELKLAATMTIPGATTGDVARVERKPDFIWLAESQPMLTNILPSVPTNANSVEITEAYDEEGAPIFHLEGDAGGQMSWSWRTKRFDVKDVSVWAKFSKNIMDDIDNFLGQIQQKLFNRLDKVVDAKLLAGNESSKPEEFNGLVTIATAFSNSGAKTYKPTERDVLVAAIGQLEGYDHQANVIVINPIDKMKLKLRKAGKDNAVLQFEDVGAQLAGLQVVVSTRMTAGKFLVFDSSKATQHVRMNAELVAGEQDADNLTKRLITLVLTKRLAFEVSVNNYKAFVYGDFATAISAMTLTT